MKFLQTFFLLTVLSLIVPACTVEVIDDEEVPTQNEARVVDIDGGFYNYQDVVVEGFDFSADCSDHQMTLVQGTTEIPLEITSCSAEEIIGFIPLDIEPGAYTLDLRVNNAVFTPSSFSNIDLDFDIKRRPVILELSQTTFSVGDVLTATGVYFENPTTQSVYDPATWVTAPGFSFQTNPTEVNADGTEATITITNNIPAGEYNLKIVSREFGNEIPVVIE